MTIWVTWYHLRDLPLLDHLASFVMTYHDHGHPIKTNIYKSAKNCDIGLKLSEYDHMGYLISLMRPNLTGPPNLICHDLS